MKFGVDFGTTRTTVALVDRGNYPLVSFIDPSGDDHDYVPSVIALGEDGLLFGFEAEAAALEGAPHLRSFKRLLSDPELSPASTVRLANRDYPLLELVSRFLAHIADMIRTSSSVSIGRAGEPLEAVVGIPAHAWSAQRFLTLEAFRSAGWTVREMLNEPSAAGLEYTHRHAGTLNSRRTSVLVYDLGGGTFDASLVEAAGTAHTVIASCGDNMLGGDDFDEVLLACALECAGLRAVDLLESERAALLRECRIAKESLSPQSKTMSVEVRARTVMIPVPVFYERASALVAHTFGVLDPLLDSRGDGERVLPDSVAGLYVVGGGSRLPLVARMLRTKFGRRVHRSAHTAGSTAIGLAIAADETAGYSLADRLSRGVGVFRELDSGRAVSFDALLSPDARWTPGESTVVTRRYRAAHNIGYYRFVEYRQRDEEGVPRGEVSPFGELLMPFDPGLRVKGLDLSRIAIVRTEDGPLVEERYLVDENGIVKVEIEDLETGYVAAAHLGEG